MLDCFRRRAQKIAEVFVYDVICFCGIEKDFTISHSREFSPLNFIILQSAVDMSPLILNGYSHISTL